MNHLVVVGESLAKDAGAVRAVYELLAASRRATDDGYDEGLDLLPFGVDALRPSLEVAIAYAGEQGLLSRNLCVEELFDGTTLALGWRDTEEAASGSGAGDDRPVLVVGRRV